VDSPRPVRGGPRPSPGAARTSEKRVPKRPAQSVKFPVAKPDPEAQKPAPGTKKQFPVHLWAVWPVWRCRQSGQPGKSQSGQSGKVELASLNSVPWVPEGSLASFLLRHHLALELVCGADFSWKWMCRAGSGDLGGVPTSAENPMKTRPKIFSQTAFGYPVF